MEDNYQINSFVEIFKLFGNETRLKIVILLSERKGEMSIKNLEKAVGISALVMSQHLARLRRLKVVFVSHHDGEAYYTLLNRESIVKAIEAVRDFCAKTK